MDMMENKLPGQPKINNNSSSYNEDTRVDHIQGNIGDTVDQKDSSLGMGVNEGTTNAHNIAGKLEENNKSQFQNLNNNVNVNINTPNASRSPEVEEIKTCQQKIIEISIKEKDKEASIKTPHTPENLKNCLDFLRDYFDISIEVKDIEKSSIKFTLKGLRKELKNIVDAFESGTLAPILKEQFNLELQDAKLIEPDIPGSYKEENTQGLLAFTIVGNVSQADIDILKAALINTPGKEEKTESEHKQPIATIHNSLKADSSKRRQVGMRTLIDTDLILECFLHRKYFVQDAEMLIDFLEAQKAECFMLELGLDRIFSFLSLFGNHQEIGIISDWIQARINICSRQEISTEIAQQSRSLRIRDIESGLEVTFAIAKNFDAIVTHKIRDFNGLDQSRLTILSVEEFTVRQNLDNRMEVFFASVPSLSDIAALDTSMEPKSERSIDLSSNNLKHADLSDADLSCVDLSSNNLKHIDLSDADLSCADLKTANLKYANLSYADLRNADLSYADLSHADLSHARLIFANLSNADLSNAKLDGAELSNANLKQANLSNANLRKANLKNTIIDDKTKLSQKWSLVWKVVNQAAISSSFSNTNLRGIDLSGSNLNGVDLRCAKLVFTDLSCTDLRYAKLSRADLNKADLSRADLRSANLSHADLKDAKLNMADLNGADLSGADLRGADLRYADLRGADLRFANLSRSQVENSRFGNNQGISQSMKCSLISQGAIFEDSPGDRSPVLV